MTTVLFVQGSAELAGAERILLALLRNIDRQRVRPVVAFLADGPVVAAVEAEGIDVVRLPSVGRLRDVAKARRIIAELRAVIGDVDPAVVQATGEKMAVYAAVAARAAGRPSIAWLHDSPAQLDRPAAAAVQLALWAARPTATITCSRWLADAFNRRLRLGAEAIPNGIELDALPEPGAGRAALLDGGCWDADSTVFVHLARLERWKGTEVFLRAAAELDDDRARFAVIGGALFGRDLEYAASLPRLADNLGLADRVWFAGHRDDALALLSGADAAVHCSLRPDPFPTVILEALALGRAAIATRTRGPEEAIEHRRTGLLVEPGDSSSLLHAMEELGASSELRDTLGAEARTTASQRWSAARMAQEFEHLWCRLGPDERSA